MNILENYIVEIHSIKPYIADWTSEFPNRDFIEVDLTSNCYGREERRKHVWDKKEFEQIKKQGFYWA